MKFHGMRHTHATPSMQKETAEQLGRALYGN